MHESPSPRDFPRRKTEQAALRAAYIAEFRASLRGTLDNTVIERPDGSREKLRKEKTDGNA